MASKRTIVLALIVAILLGAGVGYAWLEALGTRQSAPSPQLYCCLAFGVPANRTVGPAHWYNFTVQDSAGGSIQLRNLKFLVQSSYRLHLTPPDWAVTVLNNSGGSVGSFDGSTGVWGPVGIATVKQGQVFALDSPESLKGGLFVVTIGSGSVSVSIP
jgi:hypothetical protein